MANYFFDCEFIEGFHKPRFGKRRHFIDLISIGIVCEDGRTYSALSKEYDYNKASDWVKENVITQIYTHIVHGDPRNRFSISNFHKHFGLENEQIKEDILKFFGCWRDQHFWRAPEDIKVFGYFADYDWVLFCSLFGKMIDLPKGFPRYCRDLKQMMDEWAEKAIPNFELSSGRTFTLDDALVELKLHQDYPKHENEHDALADAKWNQALHKFLTS